MPERIRLSRKKGWRMPPNTVKVDRTTRFGNPFIVGRDGSAPLCVYWQILSHAGYRLLSCSRACGDRQTRYIDAVMAEKKAGWPTLRGKNLACWCEIGKPCHADVLLAIANKKRAGDFDINAFMARYGYRIVDGRAVKL